MSSGVGRGGGGVPLLQSMWKGADAKGIASRMDAKGTTSRKDAKVIAAPNTVPWCTCQDLDECPVFPLPLPRMMGFKFE